MELFRLAAFWVGIAFIVLAGGLGVTGIWVPKFWEHELGAKLIFTDLLVAGTALAACVVLKWLN